jgi:hypothetical protein
MFHLNYTFAFSLVGTLRCGVPARTPGGNGWPDLIVKAMDIGDSGHFLKAEIWGF